METGCAVAADVVVVVVDVVVDVVAAAAVVGAATRIQQRTPRLSPRAPSTPAELVISGLPMNCREMRLSTPYP